MDVNMDMGMNMCNGMSIGMDMEMDIGTGMLGGCYRSGVLAFWPFWRSGRSGGTSNLASDLAPIWRGPFWRESSRSGDRPVLAALGSEG